MNPRKTELRHIMLALISNGAFREDNLFSEVAATEWRASGSPPSSSPFPDPPRLDHEDKLLVHEIFWDLIIEKQITPGWDFPNCDLPYFRIHSEATLFSDQSPESR